MSQEKLFKLLEEQRFRRVRREEQAKFAALPSFRDWVQKSQRAGTLAPTCRCTRPLNVLRPHCPNCGSQNTYSLQEIEGMLPSGETLRVMKHRCRRCGLYFTDLEMYLHCEAEQPQSPMKEVRKKAKADEALQKAGFANVEDFKRKLHEYQAKRESTAAESVAKPGTPEWYAEHPEES